MTYQELYKQIVTDNCKNANVDELILELQKRIGQAKQMGNGVSDSDFNTLMGMRSLVLTARGKQNA